jgi:hypothetical protein
VTACRVVLKAPGGHHRTGGLYEINIHLALPAARSMWGTRHRTMRDIRTSRLLSTMRSSARGGNSRIRFAA